MSKEALTQVLALALSERRSHWSFLHGLHILYRGITSAPSSAARGPSWPTPQQQQQQRRQGRPRPPHGVCGGTAGRRKAVTKAATRPRASDQNSVVIQKQISKSWICTYCLLNLFQACLTSLPNLNRQPDRTFWRTSDLSASLAKAKPFKVRPLPSVCTPAFCQVPPKFFKDISTG